jgi:membrane protease subunit HflK
MKRKEKAALASIGVNIFQVMLKLILAAISGSISLLADAWHSLSDIFVSLMVWIGIKISGKESNWESRKVGRIENIVAIVISLFIFYAAYTISRKALGVAELEIKNLPVTIGGTLLSIIVSYFIGQYKISVGRETNSPSLVADGYHSRMDMYTSVAVLVSLVGYMIGLSIEKIAAIVVALFIVEIGVEIIVNATHSLIVDRLLDIGNVLDMKDNIIVQKLRALNEKLYQATGRRIQFDVRNFRTTVIKRRRMIVRCCILLIVLIYAFSGFYIVNPNETVIHQRFGKKISAEVEAGLHYRYPFPAGYITRTKPKEVKRIEVGFQTVYPEQSGYSRGDGTGYLWESPHLEGRYIKRPEEALMLTGDENIIDVNTVIQYYLSDPFQYHFRISDQEKLIRSAAETAVRLVIAKLSIDYILTSGREKIQDDILTVLQEILDSYRSGVRVFTVQLQDVHPPVEVVDAFRDVASAKEDRSKLINQAMGYKNEIVPRAKGEAEKIITGAAGYRTEKINKASGEAGKFSRVEKEFRKSREITSLRMYLETIESVLPDINKFIMESDVKKGKYDLWFLGKSEELPEIPFAGP